jgi:hypothetical protein
LFERGDDLFFALATPLVVIMTASVVLTLRYHDRRRFAMWFLAVLSVGVDTAQFDRMYGDKMAKRLARLAIMHYGEDVVRRYVGIGDL